MKEYPMTFDEFNSRLTTEGQCREYLCNLRFSNGFYCPKCSGDESWKICDVLFECSSCNHQISVTTGTLFQDTRKPLSLVNWDLVDNNLKNRATLKDCNKCNIIFISTVLPSFYGLFPTSESLLLIGDHDGIIIWLWRLLQKKQII